MKKFLLILCVFITSFCTAQTDSLSLYKKGYEQARELNKQYKFKIEACETVVLELEAQVADLQEIQTTHQSILRIDSLQLNYKNEQIRLLTDNLNIYQKQFNKRDKFWNKPWFGAVLGSIGTIAIIHVIDYSLPQ